MTTLSQNIFGVEHLAKEDVQPDGYLVKPVSYRDFVHHYQLGIASENFTPEANRK
jgi:hypothetical protein